MNVTRSTYYLVSGTDRPGEISRLLDTLRQNNIDLEALWAYGTPNGRADIYLVPKAPGHFQSLASGMGMSCTQGTCFRITGSDEIGVLNSTMNAIATEGINLAALNATVISGQFGGYIWCRPEDVDRVAKALNI